MYYCPCKTRPSFFAVICDILPVLKFFDYIDQAFGRLLRESNNHTTLLLFPGVRDDDVDCHGVDAPSKFLVAKMIGLHHGGSQSPEW